MCIRVYRDASCIRVYRDASKMRENVPLIGTCLNLFNGYCPVRGTACTGLDATCDAFNKNRHAGC